jgi:hypothetical protein
MKKRNILGLLLGKIVFLIGLFIASCSNNPLNNSNEQHADSLLNAGRLKLFTDIPASKKDLIEAMKYTKDSMKYYDAFEAYATLYFLENKYDSGLAMKKKIITAFKQQPESTRKKELLASV